MNDHRPLILIVDDTELNRELLKDMLSEDYRIITACNGKEAVDILEQRISDLAILLLDVVMPEMDGFEVLAMMNSRQWIENTPVIMISAETSSDFIARGYELGAVDYISRPFDANIIKRRLENTIVLYTKQKMLKCIVTEQIREKERNNALMINILSTIVEFRNGESGIHVLRIRVITEILLEAMLETHPQYFLDVSAIAVISNAAALHDVGKIAIPESILNKPGKLTHEEFEVMKTHAARGAEMLGGLHIGKDEELVRYAHDICRWHHERWDGRGYPDGLKGMNIPLCAQVVSLADVYDALTSARVYKPPYSHDEAIRMILNGECGVFNPDLILCLLGASAGLEERIRLQSKNLDKLFDVEKLSDEVVFRKSASLSDRTLFLLEQERTKNQFLAALSSDMLFDYDAQADVITITENGRLELGLAGIIRPARHHMENTTLLTPEDVEQLLSKVTHSTPEQPFLQGQYLFCMPNGERRWYELTGRILWSTEITPMFLGCIGKLVDIHEQKTSALQLVEQTRRDSLTGLYNHAAARGLAESALRARSEQVSALFIMDVDNFKTANDTYGHIFGDGVLKHIAQKLGECIRKTDVAARIGGDEFLLFLENLPDVAQVEEQAQRIFQMLSTEFQGYSCSISMGGAIYPRDGDAYLTLLNRADQALYSSKKAGKNRLAFFDETDATMPFCTRMSEMDSAARDGACL